MPSLVLTQAGSLALQSAGLAGLTNLKADVATTLPTPPGRQAVIGDFAVPTYTGYVQAAVVLTGGLVRGTNGLVYAHTGLMSWVGPSSGPGAAAIGIVLSDGTTHTVWGYITLDAPSALQVPTDFFGATLILFENETSEIDTIP